MKRILSFPAAITMLMTAISLSVSCWGAGDAESGEISLNKHIKGVTAITEVFGDGQKVSAVAVEYDKDIVSSKLSPDAFSVNGKTITKVYANNMPEKAANGVDGRYVIIEVSTSDKGSSISRNGPSLNHTDINIYVTQTREVATCDGERYTPGIAMLNDKRTNLVVDDFKLFEFKDPGTGKILRYNLFIPENYDRNKLYPMVQFVHDGSVTSTETTATLTRCIGAVIWAMPSEQKKHECFVLAPQYESQTVNDNSEYTDYLDITVNLIRSLTNQYSIDKDRIYATGQSMGCMLSIAIGIKYPDLFAAYMLVAGQWDADKMSVLADKNMWIIVAEGDTKAFPGMNASLAVMETAGAKVSRAKWNARAGEAERAAYVKRMIDEGNNIKYAVFEKGTVFPEGQVDSGNEHMQSFPIAYNIEGVRAWLFTQKR